MPGSASLFILLCVCVGAAAAEGQKNITADTGQSITLPCRAPNRNITVVEWSRADLEDEYVLFYQNGHFPSYRQHPSFKNRVDLQDRQMKDGDVSLILKDVTINDTGTYECRVVQRGTKRRKRAHLNTDPISIIYLRVDPPGHTGGHTENRGKEDGGEKSGSVGLIIGLPIVAVVVFAAVVFLIYITYNKCCQDSDHPPTEPQIEMSERFLNSESPADEHRDRNDPEANNSHQHSTRIPDVTLTFENELLHPQQTAGLLPESDIRVQ